MFSDPIAAYKQVGIESAIRGADPHQLIVLLFDGASAALSKAQEQLANNDLAGKSDSISKAIEIIVEGLSASLNVEQGGELAARLQALYAYMVSRLVHANIHRDASAIAEVQKLMSEISGAWKEIRPQIVGTGGAEIQAR